MSAAVSRGRGQLGQLTSTLIACSSDLSMFLCSAPAPAPLAPPPDSWRPIRGLAVSSASSKSSVSPTDPAVQSHTGQQATPPADLPPDETAVWGSRCPLLDSCPNSTSDFAMSAHLVSTPFAIKTPSGGGHAFPDKGTHTHAHNLTHTHVQTEVAL